MWQHCPSRICDAFFGAHACVLPQHHGGATLQTFFLWDELNEDKHSDIVL